MRPTSVGDRWLRPPDRRRDFVAALVGPRPPDAATKSQSPAWNNPARDPLKIRGDLSNQAEPALSPSVMILISDISTCLGIDPRAMPGCPVHVGGGGAGHAATTRAKP